MLFLVPLIALAAPPAVPAPLSAAAAAHAVAWDDLQRIGRADPAAPEFTRYVWLQQESDIKSVAFALRQIGRAVPPGYKPPVVGGGGRPMLTRVDFRVYWAQKEDLKRALDTWDLLANDPNFSLLITPDTIKLLGDRPLPKFVKEVDKAKKRFLVSCRPYTIDGERYESRWASVIRVPAEHLALATLTNLEAATVSQAPVVQSDYFLMRALGSIQDEGVWKDLFSGLYYRFKGVRTAKEAGKKGTDLDVFFQDLGVIDDADGKLTVKQKFEKFRSDKRVVMIKSRVTGKPRLVWILPQMRQLRGVVMVTMDFKDSSIDINQYPFANILELEPDAMEIIWTEPDATQGYALFNKQGVLQDQVPDTIAVDHDIPAPYTKRLHTIGCITCHGKEMGWQAIPNEVRRPLKGGVDILGDVGDKKNLDQADRTNRLAGLTAGQVDDLIDDLRRELAAATLRTTGPWKESKDQVDVYVLTAKSIEGVRRRYWYTDVSAEVALRELGIEPKEGKALDMLRELLPPTGEGIEDVRIAQLREGVALPRVQWDLCKGFAAARVAKSLAAKAAEEKKP